MTVVTIEGELQKLDSHKRLQSQCLKVERKQPAGSKEIFCERDKLKLKWLSGSNRQVSTVTFTGSNRQGSTVTLPGSNRHGEHSNTYWQ